MIELTSCEHVVLTYLKDILATHTAVDLETIEDSPYCQYPRDEIVKAVQNLKDNHLINVQTLPEGDPLTHLVIYDITLEGSELV